jgi:hypothetical protein
MTQTKPLDCDSIPEFEEIVKTRKAKVRLSFRETVKEREDVHAYLFRFDCSDPWFVDELQKKHWKFAPDPNGGAVVVTLRDTAVILPNQVSHIDIGSMLAGVFWTVCVLTCGMMMIFGL